MCGSSPAVDRAVDVRTGQHLWEALRVAKRAGKTIVLATHQLQLLSKPDVDRIVFVHDGAIRLVAPWAELQARRAESKPEPHQH